MKKLTLTLLFFIAILHFSFAQNVLNPTGNVGIFTPLAPTHSLTLGSTSTGIASYNTTDQTTNYERLVEGWNANVYQIGTYFGGTGSFTSLQLGVQTTAGTTGLTWGRVFTINGNTSPTAGIFDFNANTSGLNSLITMQGQLLASSGVQNWLGIEPIILQSQSGSYRALFISPYEQTVGTGVTNYLIDAGTNSAASAAGTHTSKFVVTNAGNVGIGTNSPGAGLDVRQTGGSNGIRNLSDGYFANIEEDSYNTTPWQGSRINLARYEGSKAAPLMVQNYDRLGFIDFYGYDGATIQRGGLIGFSVDATPSAGIIPSSFYVQTTNSSGVATERMRINSSGNIGVGTSAPTNTLTLATGGTGFAQYNTTDQTTAYERVVGQYQSSVYTIGSYAGVGGTPRTISMGVQGIIGATTLSGGRVFSVNYVASVPTGNFDFTENTSVAGSIVTVNSGLAGNSSQQNMFSIQGAVTQTGTAGYTGLLIAPNETSVGTGNRYLIDAGVNTAASGGGTHTPYFLLTSTGNVGIGTTDNANWQLANSQYKLAVNGSIVATAITVKLTANWPDYVFKKDYTLPSLTDVKTYIDKNQHLPDMPSEQQIAKEGVDLGEMNKLLVKKVEELTLYLIEKDKKEKEMEARLEKLEGALNKVSNGK